MIDRQARAELRTRVKNALTEVDRCAAFDPKRADLWEAIRKQLRALDLWMKDDRLPSRENLDQIMVGNIAVRELGDTYEETPPPFRPLREELVIIQDDVMNFYEPFPLREQTLPDGVSHTIDKQLGDRTGQRAELLPGGRGLEMGRPRDLRQIHERTADSAFEKGATAMPCYGHVVQRATGRFYLRYEDVAQDGRVRADALSTALGVVWRELAIPGGMHAALQSQGILPILTRITLERSDSPFAVERPLDAEGGYVLSHAKGTSGEVDKLLLDMDASITGPIGRTNLPPPDDAGRTALVGRVHAEHVFTRPFAPAGQRKVVALPMESGPLVPEQERRWDAPSTLLELPDGAVALEPEPRDDPNETVLGLTHTDSNQHVNSTVYPRLFEEAALRRFAALGRPATVLARRIELGFQRPSFAGERLRVSLRAFALGSRLGCAGVFQSGAEPKPRVYARMVFD